MAALSTTGRKQPTGMRAFLIVWAGQVISIFGSSLTAFALTIWAYELRGRATDLALVAFFSFGPAVLLSPIAGALVDRWNRKTVMMLSDLAAGLSTVAIFALYNAGELQIWHLYISGAFASAFQSFQFPAYSAAVSMMLPKSQYARAQGLMGMIEPAAQIFAPMVAAFLITLIDIDGVMLIDIVTFIAAICAVLLVYIPQPERSAAGAEGKGSIWRESRYGFEYILKRPSLLGLQLMFFQANLFGTMAGVLLAPLVLARTDFSEVALGSVQSAGAVGGLLGGILIAVWGGPKKKVHGVLLGMAANALFAQVVLGLGQTTIVWMFGAFTGFFCVNILNASNQAIWMAKVAPDVQGRVFATRRMIAQITAPVAMIVAGPLADKVFEPAMQPGGGLAGAFGPLVGTGPGAGISLMFVLTGILYLGTSLSGYLVPAIRDAERLIPDHDAGAQPEADEAVTLAESLGGDKLASLDPNIGIEPAG